MPTLQTAVLILALACSGLGFMGIVWCRCSPRPVRASWGRRLFLLILIALGGISLLTASQPHQGLLYLGLAIGALVIAMLWEGPQPLPSQRWLAEEA